MIICIEITRELEEMMVEHHEMDHVPTKDEVLEYVKTLEINYDDNYGKLKWYPI